MPANTRYPVSSDFCLWYTFLS